MPSPKDAKGEVEYRPIITLATNTVVNDQAESVLIPKVLCYDKSLKHVSECVACEHHGGVPNNFCVACKKKDDGDADNSNEADDDGKEKEGLEEE